MRDLITIGELAKILKINTSKIRFYEKMGLVKPSRHDENGYRLYGFKEMDIMLFINLLRELKVPLDELKKIGDSEKDYDFKGILEDTKEKIAREIESLKSLEKMMNRKLRRYEDFTAQDFKVTNESQRILYLPFSEKPELTDTPKKLFDFLDEYDIDYTDPNYDIYELTDPAGKKILGVHNKKLDDEKAGFKSIILPAGKYLTKYFAIKTEEEIELRFKELQKKAREMGFTPTGYRITVDDLEMLLYSADEYVLRFEIFVKTP